MTVQNTNVSNLIGQIALKLTQLPEEDLPLVAEFVDHLAQQEQSVSAQRLSIAELRAEARRRAQELSQVPRTEIVARFQELAKEIRQTVIAKNTAIEGDWLGD
jgi:uncharacterized protein YaaR (DUF327 family)